MAKRVHIALKVLLAVLLTVAAAWVILIALLAGVFDHHVSRELTSYYTDAELCGAEYFDAGSDAEPAASALPIEQLSSLADTLDDLPLIRRYVHRDYNWGGRFGLRFFYTDGTSMTYDGTAANFYSSDGMEAKHHFLSVDGSGYWAAVQPYFPDNDMSGNIE
jgi:hypothetical protein